MRPFSGNISFNTQHAPMGAFMSFTCGHFGTRGGIGAQIGKPANQDLFIGVKEGDRFSDAPLKCLPFYQATRSSGAGAADFQVEQAGPAEQRAKPKVIAYTKEQIERRYGWATDEWTAEGLTFTIFTPFGSITDPASAWPDELRHDLWPGVTARLEIDNTAGTTLKTGFFAIAFNEPGARQLTLSPRGTVKGFALRAEMGVAASLYLDRGGRPGEPPTASIDASPFNFCRWTVDEGLRQNAPHQLGTCPGIGFEVPAGTRAMLFLALGLYLPNIVTTGLNGRYFYTRCFNSLEDVLCYGIDQYHDRRHEADRLDKQLLTSGLSDDQQFLIAHATRSYYGSTQLLDVGGEPFWIVNEGEYCMMNTLDLSVDQVFWELKHNPWVVRNLLDNFVRHYSYVDEVKIPSGSPSPGGISFTHDMGAHNNFSPPGHSSYELPDLTGCFSYMTAEQLCNWLLIAATYVTKSGDIAWARHNEHVIDACAVSLVDRGPSTGIIEYDSARCGSGSEITTYDSLDHSLAQTRNNLYIAVKVWAAYRGLVALYEALGDRREYHAMALDMAQRIETSLSRKMSDSGFLPAVFEENNPGFISRILPAIEGVLYPMVWTTPAALSAAESGNGMLNVLRRHTSNLLLDPQRRNLFPDGGIKLSSTSNNSWMSKIALFQHVAREVFHLDDDPAIKDLFVKADAAHVKWQTDGSGYWACSDQFVSGIAKGSRYYPRIITTALWMEGRDARPTGGNSLF